MLMNTSPSPVDGLTDRHCLRSADPPDRAPPPSRPRPGAETVKSVLKGMANALGLAVAALPALTCWVEARCSGRDELFLFWGQAFAVVPGLPGKYLRKCFYFLTLRSCPLRCDIGFLSYFSDRQSEVGRGAYVGFGVSVGLASLGDGCLVGNRACIINGGWQHTLGPDGRLTPFDHTSARCVRIGAETWIGEGAIVMADVGGRCIIGAGSVVSASVPDGCLVAGNPARFLRRLVEDTPAPPETQPQGPSP
jgi:virginiamycin A acetyltransferase